MIAEELGPGQLEIPYAEEQWTHIRIGDALEGVFEVLGPCQRCQMVCVNQKDASRRPEPFSTLAKTRRRDGKVWFGMHMCLKQIAKGVLLEWRTLVWVTGCKSVKTTSLIEAFSAA